MGIRETIRAFFERGQPPDFLQQPAPITTSEINVNLPSLTIKEQHLVRENHPLVRQGCACFNLQKEGKTMIFVTDIYYSDSPYLGQRLFPTRPGDSMETIAELAIREDIEKSLRSFEEVINENAILECLNKVLFLQEEMVSRMHYSARMGVSITGVIIDPIKQRWKIINIGTNSVDNIIKKGNKHYSLRKTCIGDILKPIVREVSPQKLVITTKSIDVKSGETMLLADGNEGMYLVIEPQPLYNAP